MTTAAPQVNTPTPDAFKALLLAAHPNAVASDGRKYSDIPALELTQKAVQAHPDGVTNSGIKYSDFLGGASADGDQGPAPTPWSQKQDSTFTWKVGQDELDNKTGVGIKDVARPLVNLAALPLQAGETAAKIIPNAVDLVKTQGWGALGNAALEAGKTVLGPAYALGNTILGAENAGISKLTGKPVGTPDDEQNSAFQSALHMLTHPLDTATSVAQGVYKTSQEQPMTIPLALEGAAKGINKIAGREVVPNDPIASTGQLVTKPAGVAMDWATEPLRDAAFNRRVADFEKTLNMSKGISAGEVKYGKNSPEMAATLEKEGVDFSFDRDQRGRLDTTAAQANVAEIAARDNATMTKLLKTADAPVDLEQVAAEAKTAAMNEYKGTAQDAAVAHIDSELAAYKRQFAGQALAQGDGQFMLPADVANEIKQDLWSKSKFSPFASELDNVNSGTKYLMGQSIKTAIEDSVGEDNLVGRLNQRLGDIAQLQKVLERAQGGAVHGGFMGRVAGRIVGGVAGAGGGPLGSMAGAITGDMIADALNNPNRPLSWAKVVLDRAEAENPTLLQEVEARLKTSAAERLNNPRLNAPSYMPMGAAPDTSGVDVAGTKAMDEYYKNQARENTLRLPAGDPNAIPGPTMRMGPAPSMEPPAQSIFGQVSGSTPEMLPPKGNIQPSPTATPENVSAQTPSQELPTKPSLAKQLSSNNSTTGAVSSSMTEKEAMASLKKKYPDATLNSLPKGTYTAEKVVSLSKVKPSQTGEDLYNETSKGYAKGDIVMKQYQTGEYPKNVGPLTDPSQLPPIVIDKDGKIIDGNHRYAAAKMAGLKNIKVIQKIK